MNRRSLLVIIALPIVLCSCSGKVNNLPNETTNVTETVTKNTIQLNQEKDLPEGFTIEKIKSAMLEYINYRLWLYPASVMDGDGTSDKRFDNYVDESIDVEIRVYENKKSGKTVYAHTNVGQWLAIFRNKDGFIYCDGLASNEANNISSGWPTNIEEYEVIHNYSVIIPEPHKPNYGTSQRKDEIIAAIEADIKVSLEEYYEDPDQFNDEWLNVDVYIADFYEYEGGTHAWLCRQDGSITDYPVSYQEYDNKYEILTGKGYTISGVDNFNEYGKHQFQRDIQDAVKHFIGNRTQ